MTLVEIAHASIGGKDYEWLAVAQIETGKTTKRDLDKAVERGDMLSCKL